MIQGFIEPSAGHRISAHTEGDNSRVYWTRYTDRVDISKQWISHNGVFKQWSELLDKKELRENL